MNFQAQQFIENWRNRGDEKSDTHQFWTALLHDVYGVEHPENFIRFEQRVRLKNISYMDATIPFTSVLIEQKSADVDLDKKIRQSDGSELTPLEQARRYDYNLPKSQRHRWIIACNFQEFRIFDTENPAAAPVHVLLENLEKDWHVMDFLVDKTQTKAQQEQELSIAAGELVGKLYDALLAQYRDPTSPDTLRSLNILCVRLVFCFYAEDADILGRHNCVCTYLTKRKHDMRRALIDLFRILNQKQEERDEYLDDDLLAFPYVNGGLFEGDVEIPRITPEIAELLTEECSRNFDWSGIDPTIFGAVFESTLNPETRRVWGMHYTSIKNIHRVIDPLFFSDLQNELTDILAIPIEKTREKRLKDFRRYLASLTFFDPACGSGNFLTETYLSIRRLENKILRELMRGQLQISGVAIQVGIDQFYGIEINDFAVSVARTALWIAESQMLKETEGIIGRTLDFLPLHTHANIVEGNALRLDWETVVPKNQLNYILGNPPFFGKKEQTSVQKQEIVDVFENQKGAGKLDYVTGWYKKAVEYINNSPIKCAFVSTNSITQGEQVPILSKFIFKKPIEINFAYRTFKWYNRTKKMAAVHCVIIGFSCSNGKSPKIIFQNDRPIQVENINPYLVDAPTTIIKSRKKSICDVLPISYGSMPIDDGHLILSQEEVKFLLAENPQNQQLIREYIGGTELINNTLHWCLWLKDVPPHLIKHSKFVLRRIEETECYRRQSGRKQTRELANIPLLFGEIRQPQTCMLVIPKVSSGRRRYIPMAFVKPEIIVSGSALIIPDATLYHFGILTSSVHMAWMRAVCGRMKSDYQYSNNIVYNNFPWPEIRDEKVSAQIEQTAQGILDARSLYPENSLADLYDVLTMPVPLRRAHLANDLAVLAAYGFPRGISEPEIVAELMKRYQELTIDRR